MSRGNPNSVLILRAVVVFVGTAVIAGTLLNRCGSGTQTPTRSFSGMPITPEAGQTPQADAVAPILAAIRRPAEFRTGEGLAIAILLDTSGSMRAGVTDIDGRSRPKIDVARRCVLEVVNQADRHAKQQPGKITLLSIYEFSSRGNIFWRRLVPPGPPNPGAAAAALERVNSNGGTPIGEAMIQAKRDLDDTRLSRLHMIVVTDGENTDGPNPTDVMTAISQLPEDERPAIYFIAFDVGTHVFKGVKDAGGIVLSASDARELSQALEFLLGQKILLEQ
jgi:hypothetical protein